MAKITDARVGYLASVASNIKSVDDNPSFTTDDFFVYYPQFQGVGGLNSPALPTEVVDMYIEFANAALSAKKYGKQWKLMMCLFVAHFCTLYLQSYVPENVSAQQVIAASQAKGLVTSKSVGDVSVNYDFQNALSGLDGWANWGTTSFGIQFAAIAKMFGHGGMYIY